MEPIGLVASVVTLVAVIDKTVKGVRRATRLWKDAPTEVRELVDLLDNLQTILKPLQECSNGEVDQFFAIPVAQIQSCAERLRRILLDTKILAEEPSGSSPAGTRTAWIIHRNKIRHHRERLSDARDALSFALISSQNYRLYRIEALLRTRNSEAGAILALTESTTQLATEVSSAVLALTCLPREVSELTLVEEHDDTSSRSLQRYSKYTRQPDPATLLECSPNFFPETYTLERDPIVFYDSKEILQSNSLRYVYYTMLILDRRRFTRNTLKVEISKESKYWPALRAKPASIGYRKAYEPIKEVKGRLLEFLYSQGPLPQDAQIDLFLGSSEGEFSVDRNLRQSRKTQEYLKEISGEAKHMNFPRVKERELIHNPISWKYEAVRLQAKLKSSGWLIAVRFEARDDHMDEERYALQVLFKLHGKNGFCSLTHLVEDETDSITGFLCRNPTQGPLLDHLASSKQHGTLVDWSRRERWCRQIVEGISALHGNGLKHGSLGRFLRNGLYIDDHDNVTFLNSFRHSFTYADDLQDLSIPPECRRPRGDDSAIAVQPATDIYQMGLILWCIAANEDAFYRSTVPRLEPDDKLGIMADTQLPTVDPNKAPSYMNRIISMCRAARPEDRPTARLLLQEFPPADFVESESPRVRELRGVDEANDNPAEVDNMVAWPINIRCRRCHAPTADHYYHCGRCLVAVYYDICPACFDEGHHCLDDDHYLQELRRREPQGMYYSCRKENGVRRKLEC